MKIQPIPHGPRTGQDVVFPVGTDISDRSPYAWMNRGLDKSLYSVENFTSGSGLSVYPIIISEWPDPEAMDANDLVWPPNGFAALRNITIEGCLSEIIPESC